MPTPKKKKSPPKKRTGEDVYIGKYEHLFNKRWTTNELKALADELIEWMELENTNLWYKDFFVEKRISRRRLSEFREKDKYFNYILNLCDTIQESRMFKMGASRKNNPAMFIIGLKNNHDWKDKQELEMPEGININVTVKGLDNGK